MIIRAINSDTALESEGPGDWTFGQGFQNYRTETDAIVQNIKTRLRCFVNDCFFDAKMGVDWWRLLGSKNVARIVMEIRKVIVESEGVTYINSVDVAQDRITRELTITYNINTLYSQNVSGSTTI